MCTVKSNEIDHVIVCLYVDDMLVIGGNINIIMATKQMLANKLEMTKDLGIADVILGNKIYRTLQGLTLSQSHYVDKMLEKYKKYDTVITKTPIDVSLHLGKNIGDSITQLEYSCIINSLMYIMSCTHLDITYVVSKLSCYTSNPGQDHWKAILKIF